MDVGFRYSEAIGRTLGLAQRLSAENATLQQRLQEISGLVAALQRASGDQALIPEGWHPGDDVLLAPSTMAVSAGDADWFCKRVADQ